MWFLAATDLLDNLLSALNAALDDCRRLPTSVHMLRGGRTVKRLSEEYTKVVWRDFSIIQRIKKVPALEQIPRLLDLVDALSSINDLDPGEVTLFALSVENRIRVVTGDLRAIAALSKALPNLTTLTENSFDGRIVTLLCCIDLLVSEIGVQNLQNECCAAGVRNKTVLAILGASYDAPEGSVQEGISSYKGHEDSIASFQLFWRE